MRISGVSERRCGHYAAEWTVGPGGQRTIGGWGVPPDAVAEAADNSCVKTLQNIKRHVDKMQRL